MANQVRAAAVGELADGEMKVVDGERLMVLVNLGGALFAVDDECTHSACSMSDGLLDQESIECSCHGSIFNVKTGEVEQGPAEEPLPTYDVKVEGDTVYIVSE